MFTASNIHYEISDRDHGIAHGGIGAIHAMVRQLGLVEAIDQNLHLFRFHLPYHESDHVLNLAYNPLCDGTCLEDIELHRNDEVFLDALGARRIPDPTTAGDFCRRFDVADKVVSRSFTSATRNAPHNHGQFSVLLSHHAYKPVPHHAYTRQP